MLDGLGHRVVLAHPLKTKLIAEAKIKTDKMDAKTRVELLRGSFLPTSYVPPKEIRALRHLVRHRIFLGRYRGIIKNQIKTELRRRNLKYPDGAGIFVGKGKKWLCNLKDPVVDSYLAIYEAVDRELKNAEREIEKAGKEYEEVTLMTGIKGIGVYSALIIYSEIEDCSRFSNEENVCSYAGLVPRVHQSGNTSYYAMVDSKGTEVLKGRFPTT